MITNWLSRYRPRYIRSLVYMLQASEYVIGDYLSWFNRTANFSAVEKRKRLVKTPKTLVLFMSAWLMLLGLYVSIAIILLTDFTIARLAVALMLFVLTPYILLYALAAAAVIIGLLQYPLKFFIVRRAQKKLAAHQGYKIAIAGSFGKTTMREILRTVLSETKRVAAPPHSNNVPLSISKFINRLTGNEDVLIFEFGEYYPGDIRELCELVKPDLGIITGVNEAHLKKFRTLEQTQKTIFELAECLGAKPLYVNAESPLAKRAAPPGALLYSRTGVDSMKVADIRTGLDGTSFTLLDKENKFSIKSGLLGLHEVGPLATASHIALQLGFTASQVESGLAKTKPFEHRLQSKIDRDGVITLDDSYNGNPSGVKAIIEFLSGLKNHRRFFVTPGLVEMGQRSEEVHKEIGEMLAKAGIEKVILIKNSVTPSIEAGLHQANYAGEIIWFDEALAAYAALSQMTVRGDVIVLQNDWPDQYG